MPFARPTLTELRRATAGDINAALPGSDALLRWSNLGIVAEVLAGLASGHYGYLDWLALQMVPFTATGEYLEGWAALKGVTRKAAAPATGSVTLTGTNGATVPAGAALSRSDGAAYLTLASATIAAGTAVAQVRAVTPGAAGNSPAGSIFNLAVGIAGVAVNAISGALTAGADVETDDDLRTRMLIAFASPAHGGNADDYVNWALEVPGVTRCWPQRNAMGSGTVVLLFMKDVAQAANGGFPQGSSGVATSETRAAAATGDQLVLANAVYPRQPVTALVYAAAPLPNTIALTIAGIATASATTKAAITAAFKSALLINARPGGVTNISTIEAAIAAVTGSAGFVLTTVTCSAGTVAPGSAGNITSNTGALPTPGAITYV